MQLPEVPVDRRAQRARSRSDFYQAYSESQEFNAIVFRNWTANEMGEVRNREASAAIDYEANMLWLRDAAP
jgi:hypothetical protein